MVLGQTRRVTLRSLRCFWGNTWRTGVPLLLALIYAHVLMLRGAASSLTTRRELLLVVQSSFLRQFLGGLLLPFLHIKLLLDFVHARVIDAESLGVR